MLEKGHKRHRRHQDPQESPVLRAAGSDRGVDPVPAQSGECRRVQLCPGAGVLPAQKSHLPGVRDAGAEPVRLPEAEQILPVASEVHKADPATGRCFKGNGCDTLDT